MKANAQEVIVCSDQPVLSANVGYGYAADVLRGLAEIRAAQMETPLNPFANTEFAKNVAAACEVFEGMTRRYGKPEFGIEAVRVGRKDVVVQEEVLLRKPFGQFKHFRREGIEDGPAIVRMGADHLKRALA